MTHLIRAINVTGLLTLWVFAQYAANNGEDGQEWTPVFVALACGVGVLTWRHGWSLVVGRFVAASLDDDGPSPWLRSCLASESWLQGSHPSRALFRACGASVGPGTRFGAHTKIVASPLVTIGKRCQVGQGVLIRAVDEHSGVVGSIQMGSEIRIGVRARIESGAIVEDRARIGADAVVEREAHIEADGALADGSVLIEGATIPSGELWAGIPAAFIGNVERRVHSESAPSPTTERRSMGGL